MVDNNEPFGYGTRMLLNAHLNLVIGKSTCPCCDKAKKMLDKKGISYTYLDRTDCMDAVEEIRKTKNHHTYPKIFINGVFIGGYSDLKRYYSQHRN